MFLCAFASCPHAAEEESAEWHLWLLFRDVSDVRASMSRECSFAHCSIETSISTLFSFRKVEAAGPGSAGTKMR